MEMEMKNLFPRQPWTYDRLPYYIDWQSSFGDIESFSKIVRNYNAQKRSMRNKNVDTFWATL